MTLGQSLHPCQMLCPRALRETCTLVKGGGIPQCLEARHLPRMRQLMKELNQALREQGYGLR
jgi:hypothetical protein